MRKIRRNPLDKVFSDFIRERDNWTCQRCLKFFPEGQRMGIHASHFFKRRHRGTRWHEKNVDALCYGCHSYFETNFDVYERWKVLRIGLNEVEKLRALAHSVTKFTPADLEWLKRMYKGKLKQLQERSGLPEVR